MIAFGGLYDDPMTCRCSCGRCRCTGTTSTQVVTTSTDSRIIYESVPRMNRHERRRYIATGKLPDAKNSKPHWRR